MLACQPPKREGGTGWQIDAEFPRLAPTAAAEGDNGGGDGDGGAAADPAKRAKLAPRVISRHAPTDLGDSVTISMLACPRHVRDTSATRPRHRPQVMTAIAIAPLSTVGDAPLALA